MKTNLETCHHQAYIVAKTKFEHLKARYTFIVDDVIDYYVIDHNHEKLFMLI